MSAHKCTARQVSEMRRHYLDGEKCATIAAWHDVSENTVRWHTRDIRRIRRPKVNMSALTEMRAGGLTIAEMAKRFSVTPATIHVAIRKLEGREPAPIKRLSADEIAEIQRRYLTGEHITAIVRNVGVATETVYRYVRCLPEAQRRAA